MKTEEIVVALVSTPFCAQIECDNNNNTADDMRRMAYAEAYHHFPAQDWQPFIGEDGEPRVKVEGLFRQRRVVLEDGDPIPEGVDIDDAGMGTSDLEAWDGGAEEQGTITGGEDTTVSSEQDEQGELIETLLTCLQTYVEIDDRDRAGQPVPTDEREACREQARAALAAALSEDDLDEHGQSALTE